MSAFDLLGAGAGLIAALAVPAAMPAQGGHQSPSQAMANVGAGADSGAQAVPLVTRAVMARLAPMKWMYVTRLLAGGGTPQRIGFRTISLTDTTYHGMAAWLAVEARQLHTVSYAESLYVSKADLSPLHRVLHTPTGEVVSEYGADSIHTTFDDDSGHVAVAMANEPGVVAGMYLFEPLVGASPLGSKWATSARLLAIGRHESGIVNVETRVVGEERVRIPDGEFDAWVLMLRIGSGEEKLWVRKSDGVLLREQVPVVGMHGARVDMILGLHGVER